MTQEQGARRARPRPQLRNATVSAVERLTASVVRVTFGGDAFEGFELRGPAGHVRIWFPQPGRDAPLMPETTDNGPVMLEGEQRPESRVYTPRDWDTAKRALTVDFILHGDGPGSTWAASAEPGAKVVLSGPSGRFQIDPDADWYLLVADQTALPALTTILRGLSSSVSAEVFLEVENELEEQPLDTSERVKVTWLHRGRGAGMGEELRAAVRKLHLPEGARSRAWVSCEASVLRDIRRHLVNELGMEPSSVYSHAYWRAGTANHPDHDFGEDVER